MDAFEILSRVSVINRDDGKRFTQTDRLDAITALLWKSKYRRINSDGLFHLYSPRPLQDIKGPVVIVSSHADCQENITRCFTEMTNQGLMRGTYDNSITNASALSLMLSGDMPDHILFCFTGDEECDSHGARDLAGFLQSHGIAVQGIAVLDVTDMGWKQEADFTIENNFWNDALGKKIVSLAIRTGYTWKFVPSAPDDIPFYIEKQYLIPIEAEEDESWEYDEHHLPCFSFCIPVYGEMHSDDGVLARVSSFHHYIEALSMILLNIQA